MGAFFSGTDDSQIEKNFQLAENGSDLPMIDIVFSFKGLNFEEEESEVKYKYCVHSALKLDNSRAYSINDEIWSVKIKNPTPKRVKELYEVWKQFVIEKVYTLNTKTYSKVFTPKTSKDSDYNYWKDFYGYYDNMEIGELEKFENITFTEIEDNLNWIKKLSNRLNDFVFNTTQSDYELDSLLQAIWSDYCDESS
jgi:hypothetical protein